jgi:hypothetical protein
MPILNTRWWMEASFAFIAMARCKKGTQKQSINTNCDGLMTRILALIDALGF